MATNSIIGNHQFKAKEIRDILKSKAYCLRAGFSANDMIIETLNEIRLEYIKYVGLSTYLSQMLGPLATVETQHCTLYSENGERLKLHANGIYGYSIQRFIARYFQPDSLPFKVVINKSGFMKMPEVRYL